MQDIIRRVKASGQPPTRQDIADVLVLIGTPGELRPEKEAAVRELFTETGHNPFNGAQGFHVVDDLSDYEAY